MLKTRAHWLGHWLTWKKWISNFRLIWYHNLFFKLFCRLCIYNVIVLYMIQFQYFLLLKSSKKATEKVFLTFFICYVLFGVFSTHLRIANYLIRSFYNSLFTQIPSINILYNIPLITEVYYLLLHEIKL
jgi:hypothetical protein